jgi:pimeloyl-ACP methyl ester carboxylesterase
MHPCNESLKCYSLAEMSERLAHVNGIQICYETLGDPGGRPLLLVMGLGGPLIWWDDALCRMFVERGFHVIRFDNRDCGRSTRMESAPRPRPLRALLGATSSASYTLDDVAADAAGLLDHLGLPAAHVTGVSMGGMIAQTLAISHPGRVLSLASIMSSTGSRRVGWARPRLLPLLARGLPRTRAEYVAEALRLWRLIGSPGFPFDEERIRRRAEDTFDRGVDPAATARQFVAIAASGNRTAVLRGLRVPAVVIHGADDPLIHVSGGAATARAIPGAELLVIRGMGHDLPAELWPTVVDAVDRTAGRADSPALRTSAA